MNTNELMIELESLWDGEWDTVEIATDIPYHATQWHPPITWFVDLKSMKEYAGHHADFTEYTWRFSAETLEEALDGARDIATQLKGLAPEED